MSSSPLSTPPNSLPHRPQYAWEVATLFPEQGSWSEGEYLNLTDGSDRLIELTDGKLELFAVVDDIPE